MRSITECSDIQELEKLCVPTKGDRDENRNANHVDAGDLTVENVNTQEKKKELKSLAVRIANTVFIFSFLFVLLSSFHSAVCILVFLVFRR